MDKKNLGGIVLFGLGLFLVTLGFFIMLMIIAIPSHEAGTLLRVLLGLYFFFCGLVSTISGGIMMYISSK